MTTLIAENTIYAEVKSFVKNYMEDAGISRKEFCELAGISYSDCCKILQTSPAVTRRMCDKINSVFNKAFFLPPGTPKKPHRDTIPRSWLKYPGWKCDILLQERYVNPERVAFFEEYIKTEADIQKVRNLFRDRDISGIATLIEAVEKEI